MSSNYWCKTSMIKIFNNHKLTPSILLQLHFSPTTLKMYVLGENNLILCYIGSFKAPCSRVLLNLWHFTVHFSSFLCRPGVLYIFFFVLFTQVWQKTMGYFLMISFPSLLKGDVSTPGKGLQKKVTFGPRDRWVSFFTKHLCCLSVTIHHHYCHVNTPYIISNLVCMFKTKQRLRHENLHPRNSPILQWWPAIPCLWLSWSDVSH